ncbi:tetratricopeptide repeat protein [Rufibacter roseus]
MVKKAEKEQKLTVTPEVLMVRGNQVPFEIEAQLPQNLLKKNYNYNIRVFYKAAQGVEQHVGSLPFEFGNYNFVGGKPTIKTSFSFPYTPSKIQGQLMAQGVVTNPKGRKKFTKATLLAPGIRTTPHMIQVVHAPSYVADQAKAQVPDYLKFTIYFDEGLATLRKGLGTNFQQLDEFILSNQKTKRIDILATQSPNTDEYKTRNLAMRRAVALEQYIKKKIDTETYANTLSSIKFEKKVITNSWSAFLGRIQNSALPEEQIQQILDIVNGPGSFSEKENQLQELPSYEYIDMYVYPVLRYAEVTVDYVPTPRKDYEIYLLAKKIMQNRANADALSADDMQYAATLTPLLAEKKKIYESAVENYMSWQALNNLGIVYFEQAQKELNPKIKKNLLENAILNLQYAAHRNPTAQQFYNLAVAHHQNGNVLEAMHSYDYAIKQGGAIALLQNIFTDKAALELKLGQYDDAVRSISFAGSGYAAQFNKALLYFLKENYEGASELAVKLLQEFPEDASTHYLLAVIGARTQQESLMAEHLQKAVALQPTLAGKAIEDLEFVNYHKSQAFSSALKK